MHDRPRARAQHQVAGAVDCQAFDARQLQADARRVGPRIDDELVAQAAAFAVEHRVDAGIDVAVTDRAIAGDGAVRAAVRFAAIVVDGVLQPALAHRLCALGRAGEQQRHDRLSSLGLAGIGQNDAVVLEERGAVAAAR